jgi:hypothetical protein
MNIIDLLSDDDEDDALLMGSTTPIFTYSAPRPKTEPVALSTPKAELGAVPKTEAGAPTTAEAAPKTEAVALSTPKAEPGAVPRTEAGAPTTAEAAPKTEAGEAAVVAVTTTEPEQDSKPVVTMLGSCHFSIVGIQYAKAKVSVGESVKLQREPTNVSTVVALLWISATSACIDAILSPSFVTRYSFAIPLLS